MIDEEWIEMTRMGSAYREEMLVKGNKWRHKPYNSTSNRFNVIEWLPGKAPDNPSSED